MSDNVVFLPSRAVQTFRYPSSDEFGRGQRLIASGEPFAPMQAVGQQELAAAVTAAREQGMREAHAQANAAAAAAIEKERAAVSAAIEGFERRRKEYFRQVEVEAVRLALSIAKKVLRREAQMDPLLLSGVVRVAIDQMQRGTRVTLRTSPDCVSPWNDFCANHLAGEQPVEVLPDAGLKSHECVLETELGTTEISLDGQLDEIESGFFDCLRQPSPEIA